MPEAFLAPLLCPSPLPQPEERVPRSTVWAPEMMATVTDNYIAFPMGQTVVPMLTNEIVQTSQQYYEESHFPGEETEVYRASK